MADRGVPVHGLSPRALAVAGWSAFLAAGSLFMAIAWNVAGHTPLVLLDARVSAWLHAHAVPWLTLSLLAVTHLNSTLAIAAWTTVFVALLARRREWAWVVTVAMAVGGGMGLNVLLKLAYERARPHFDDPLVSLATFSFPSGHTAGAALFYGVLAAWLASRTPRFAHHAAYGAAAVAAVALVGFSRVYLGAHYPSDVAAAACASTAWLVLSLVTVHGLVKRRRLAAHGPVPPFRWQWVLGALVVGLALVAVAMLPLRTGLDRFEAWLEHMDVAQALLAFTAVYVAASVLLVPGWIFPLAAGVVFGFRWGLLATILGATLGAVVPFLITRHVLRARIERMARRNDAFRGLADAVRREPWKMVALLRLSPVLPSPLKSYFLGLCSVGLAAYATASAAGMLPGLLLRVYLGAIGRDALSRDAGPLHWTLLGAGLIATLGATLIVRRIARRKLQKRGQG